MLDLFGNCIVGFLMQRLMCFQDDTKVVLSKPEVITMVETVQKQQQQFSDLPEHIPLDPHIPITFTKVSI